MSNTASYSVCNTVTIVHEYFNTDKCHLDLVPSAGSAQQLKKAGMIFRKQNRCTWIMLKLDGAPSGTSLSDSKPLQFDLRNHTAEFYYYSQPTWEAPVGMGCKLEYIGRNGVWAALTMPTVFSEAGATLTIPINSKQKFWEFILLPKSGIATEDLQIRDDKNLLHFEKGEWVKFPGEKQPVLRFVSTEAVTLRDSYPYRIRLWENKTNGENMLCSLTSPKPSAMSTITPENTITSYCYY